MIFNYDGDFLQRSYQLRQLVVELLSLDSNPDRRSRPLVHVPRHDRAARLPRVQAIDMQILNKLASHTSAALFVTPLITLDISFFLLGRLFVDDLVSCLVISVRRENRLPSSPNEYHRE
ncbi:hypothetical protein KQX54_004241 [Cotesia glomerata]|uniref:Uncharacterized protein n=1 Tax=Cotesia glomerata TaxID=32391 RepID=A0AAV7IXA5_COTGL|nr:hypothetical protein KQX54_004241 [Cotesia glomerata]